DHATGDRVAAAVRANATEPTIEPYLTYDQYRAAGGYQTLAAVASGARALEDVLKTMESSGLRGLGGAGFPAGRKWRIVRAVAAPGLRGVNSDEGERDTLKAPYYPARAPPLFREGMLCPPHAPGIGEFYVSLRDESGGCREIPPREPPPLAGAPPVALPK